LLHLVQLQIGQSLNIDHLIPSTIHRPDQFVQFEIDRAGIAFCVFE